MGDLDPLLAIVENRHSIDQEMPSPESAKDMHWLIGEVERLRKIEQSVMNWTVTEDKMAEWQIKEIERLRKIEDEIIKIYGEPELMPLILRPLLETLRDNPRG